MTSFKPGDRVIVVVWGQQRTGTVERIGQSFVFVRLDGSGSTDWFFPESLIRVR